MKGLTRAELLRAAGAIGLSSAALSVGTVAIADTPPSVLAARISEYVRSFAQTNLFAGVVRVQRGHEVLLDASFGVAERAFGAPMRTNTKFQVASLSKPITAAAVARLVDRGILNFESHIGQFVQGVPNGDQITIEQLLTHYSGLDSPDRAAGSGEWMRQRQTTDDLVARIRQTRPLFPPGARYEYSNANYWLLAYLIERLSGVSYEAFLQREIFLPAGMTDSGHRGDLLAVIPDLAPGYQLDGPSRFRIGELIDWTSKTGNGSLYSTAADISKFYDALIGRRLLSQETTSRVIGEGRRYGFAWFHRDVGTFGHESIRFNGRSPGYSDYLEGFVNDGMSFVILSNLYVYAPTIMAEGIAAILWGRPYQLQRPIELYPLSPAALGAFEGNYQFDETFFVRNGSARVTNEGDHLKMHWSAGGLTTVLLPVSQRRFFDPTFWATITFDAPGGSLHYQSYGFDAVYFGRRTANE